MEYLEFIKKYNKEHACCPKCHGRNISSTLVGYRYDENHPEEYKNKNSVKCHDCGWKGIFHDLVPRPLIMDKDTIIEISNQIQKRADEYKKKIYESFDSETEARWSECNTILAMLTGFLNNI